MMTYNAAIKILEDQLDYQTNFKKKCDSCIPQEQLDALDVAINSIRLLELIKKHPVEFSWVYQSKNYTEYMLIGGTTIPFRFSDKEYIALKELLNDK